jgi:GH24 family phage-related lysozyme (muramidase)
MIFGIKSGIDSSKTQGTASTDVPTSASDLEKFIANHEGFSATAYRGIDSYNLTIGYGHVITEGDGLSATSVITQDQALQLMINDISEFEPYVDDAFSGYNLTTSQHDALIDFAYGEGVAPFTQNWSIISAAKEYLEGSVTADELKQSFLEYTEAGGQSGVLTSRRTDEWNLFCYGDYGLNPG